MNLPFLGLLLSAQARSLRILKEPPSIVRIAFVDLVVVESRNGKTRRSGPHGPALEARAHRVAGSPIQTAALTGAEQADLLRHETVIRNGFRTFLEVGRALAAIRDSRLYRAQYGSFEAYCRGRWDYGRAYCYRLISAAGVVDQISELRNAPSVVSESQVRPLIGLEPETVREVWGKAAQEAGDQRITGQLVRKVLSAKVNQGVRRRTKVDHSSSAEGVKSPQSVVERALHCLQAIEDAIRLGTVNKAELAYVHDLRRCLEQLS